MSSQGEARPDAAQPTKKQGLEKFFVIPMDLAEYFKDEENNKLERLRKAYPWLLELDKDDQANFSSLRQAFLTDGHTFMSALGEFLDARKWQEFVLQTCSFNSTLGPVLFGMLNFTFGAGLPLQRDVRPIQMRQRLFDRLGVSGEGRTHSSRLLQAIASRCDEPAISDLSYKSLKTERVVSELKKVLQLYSASIEKSLLELYDSIHYISVAKVDKMTFRYYIDGALEDSQMFIFSAHWRRIGQNLCSLWLLVGADVPRWPDEHKPVTLVTALKNVINNEGAAVNIMLGRIEEQSVKIQRQQQVITALRFRHLLENLPRTLRDRQVAAAGDEAAKLVVADRWDKEQQVDRWLYFWEEAVKHVYTVYREQRTPTEKATLEHRPSPFHELLQDYLAEAYKKGNDANAVRWLAYETIIGRHVKDLYSNLSQIIHQFSDGNFTVNFLNFSPSDARILAALVPEDRGKEAVNWEEALNWKKEFRRYVWANLETAGAAQPRVEVDASDEAALARVERLWKSLSNSSFPGILPEKLTPLSVTHDAGAKTTRITALYIPAANHTNSDGWLNMVVLAALVDAVGRLALVAHGQRVTREKIDVKFSNIFETKPGEDIVVSGTTSMVGKGDRRNCNADVNIEGSGGRPIAMGHLKAFDYQREKEEV